MAGKHKKHRIYTLIYSMLFAALSWLNQWSEVEYIHEAAMPSRAQPYSRWIYLWGGHAFPSLTRSSVNIPMGRPCLPEPNIILGEYIHGAAMPSRALNIYPWDGHAFPSPKKIAKNVFRSVNLKNVTVLLPLIITITNGHAFHKVKQVAVACYASSVSRL